MIDLCSTSHLLALGSPRPLWNSLREGQKSTSYAVEIVVSSSPSHTALASLGGGEESKEAEEDNGHMKYAGDIDRIASLSSMEKVPSLVMLTPARVEEGRAAAEESKEQEEEDESQLISSFRVIFDDETTTTTNATIQKVPSLASIQIRKVPSLSSITTQVGDLTKDFEKVLINQEQAQSTQGTNTTTTTNNKVIIQVGMLLKAFRSMESAMRKAGMSLSANDLAGNIRKVENLYRQAAPLLGDQRDDMMTLLKYEIESGVHKWGLSDNSAAMGLLWLGRNLSYQYDMYRFMLEDDKDPMEAALQAFQNNLQPHLNWAVARLVQAGISSLTPSKQCIFFSTVGGFDANECSPQQCSAAKRDVTLMMDQWEPLLAKWKDVFTTLKLGTI